VGIDEWFKGNLFRVDARKGIYTVAVVVGVACLISVAAYVLQRLLRPAEFHTGNPWVHALGHRPRGKTPWVALEIDDGRIVEGLLYGFSLTDTRDDRDIVLRRPIRVTVAGEYDARLLDSVDLALFPDRSIKGISVIHAPERVSSSVAKWRRLARLWGVMATAAAPLLSVVRCKLRR
jgi:hypothetical protein